MLAVIDDIISSADKDSKLPRVRITGLNILVDPERPSFVPDREAGRSQFHYLERSLIGANSSPPAQNPIWAGLMDVARRIRTQQDPEPAAQPGPSIPDEAIPQTALLTEIGLRRIAMLDRLEEISPTAPHRETILRGTGLAALALAMQATRTQTDAAKPDSSIAREMNAAPGTAVYWTTPESLSVRDAVKSLAATTSYPVAQAVIQAAAAEGASRSQPAAADLSANPDFATAWHSAPGRALRDRMRFMDRAIDSNQKDLLASTVIKAANEEGFSGRHPSSTEMAKTPGFQAAWESQPGSALRTAMTELRSAVHTYLRNDAPSQAERDGRPIPDARETYDRWSAAVPTGTPRTAPRWTNDYTLTMDSRLEAEATKPFVDLALRSLDANRTPTHSELRKDVSDVRALLSQPLKKTEAVIAAYDDLARTGRSQKTQANKPVVREITIRPNIVGENPYNSHLVGLEGQSYYNNAKAITAAMRSQARGTTLISFPKPGSEFKNALEAAAQQANIPVITGQLSVTNFDSVVFGQRARTNVDQVADGSQSWLFAEKNARFGRPNTAQGWNPADEAVVRVARQERTLLVPSESGALVPFDSPQGKRATRGALVLVDVTTPRPASQKDSEEPAMNFIARINNAALTAPTLIAFGFERAENNIFKMGRRRALSGMSTPTVIDKNGHALPPAQTAALIAARGNSRADERAAATTEMESWSTNDPRAHLAVQRLLPKNQDAQLRILNSYRTLGEAVDTGARALASPRGQNQISNDEERANLFAAAHLAKAFANPHTTGLVAQRIADRVTWLNKNDNQMIDILADPRDKAVASAGILYGFSSQAARSAPNGSRYAIIGDEAPVSTHLGDKLDKIMQSLATLHGRNGAGIAQLRINTTLTPGIGEEVMLAGLRNKVPVEAYSNKDERNTALSADDRRLFATAAKLQSANLGGTWSLADHDTGPYTYGASRLRVARAAIDGADAIIASRIGRDDGLKLVVAAAARTRPLLAMRPQLEDDGTARLDAWEGTQQLTRPNTKMRAVLGTSPQANVPYTFAGSQMSRSALTETEGVKQNEVGRVFNTRVLLVETSTGSGARELTTARDLKDLHAAAQEQSPAMRLAGPSERTPAPRSPTAPAVRWDVVYDVDLNRFHQPAYRKSFDLTPQETRLVQRTHQVWMHKEAMSNIPEPPVEDRNSDLAALLATKFKVTARAEPSRQPSRSGAGR